MLGHTENTKGIAVGQLLTIDDLSERLKVPRETLRRWRRERRLPPAIKVGRAVRWRAEEIDRWIERNVAD